MIRFAFLMQPRQQQNILEVFNYSFFILLLDLDRLFQCQSLNTGYYHGSLDKLLPSLTLSYHQEHPLKIHIFHHCTVHSHEHSVGEL